LDISAIALAERLDQGAFFDVDAVEKSEKGSARKR
jgi:hypothetical protein